jgi:hypothetical protein
MSSLTVIIMPILQLLQKFQLILKVSAVVLAILGLVHLLLRRRRVQAKISNIPGPESKSWTGMSSYYMFTMLLMSLIILLLRS